MIDKTAFKFYLTKIKSPKGFTLIELLLVMGVIGILAGITIVAINPVARMNEARAAIIQQDFKTMTKVIEAERIKRQLVLGRITGSFWTMGGACSTGDVRDPACVVLANTSWRNVTGKDMPKDPYGNPYLLDENEAEPSYPGCRPDGLYSAGPDHLTGTPDGISYSVPTFFCY